MADFNDLKQGDSLPELRVTPDKYLPHRYAGASGDFNPIHIDPVFAKAVVKEAGDGRIVTDTVAVQGDNQIIRNSEAELDLL